jgi:hypothetical protein
MKDLATKRGSTLTSHLNESGLASRQIDQVATNSDPAANARCIRCMS